jgi:hypothetical protein
MAACPIIIRASMFTSIAYDDPDLEGGYWVKKIPALRVLKAGTDAVQVNPRLGRRESEPLLFKRFYVRVFRHKSSVPSAVVAHRHSGRMRYIHKRLHSVDRVRTRYRWVSDVLSRRPRSEIGLKRRTSRICSTSMPNTPTSCQSRKCSRNWRGLRRKNELDAYRTDLVCVANLCMNSQDSMQCTRALVARLLGQHANLTISFCAAMHPPLPLVIRQGPMR